MRKITLILGSSPTLNAILEEDAKRISSPPAVIVVPAPKRTGEMTPLRGTRLHINGKRRPVASGYPQVKAWLDTHHRERVARKLRPTVG